MRLKIRKLIKRAKFNIFLWNRESGELKETGQFLRLTKCTTIAQIDERYFLLAL
ncbi:MAG: hypothetical protein WC149_08690 [Arcobacteraceae bacterium]|nr:hypothetical protein [Bacilli bacterium]